jgi:hypothetical protein
MAAAKLRNLDACLQGSVECDPAALQPAEIAKVHTATTQRNVERCLNGAANCDPMALTPEQAASVAVARKRRNLENCVDGFFSKCDMSILTAPELDTVKTAERQRSAQKKQ